MTKKEAQTIGPVTPEEILHRFELAKDEDYEFGRAAEALLVCVFRYDRGAPIPREYSDLYRQFATASSKDATGALVFPTETQVWIASLIRGVMRNKGLLVRLPEEKTLIDLMSAAAEYSYAKETLAQHFFPVILDRAGEEFEAHSFLILLTDAMMSTFEGHPQGIHDKLADSVSQLGDSMIDSLVDNPAFAGYVGLHWVLNYGPHADATTAGLKDLRRFRT